MAKETPEIHLSVYEGPHTKAAMELVKAGDEDSDGSSWNAKTNAQDILLREHQSPKKTGCCWLTSRKFIFALILVCAAVTLTVGLSVGLKRDPQTSWPECVGILGNECKALILKDRPDLFVVVMYPGTVSTMEMNLERVKILVDTKTSLVKRAPHLG